MDFEEGEPVPPARPRGGSRGSLGERLELLVDAAWDYAIFTLDTEGYVTSWNPGAERLKGYSADEIIGQHFSRFYPDEARRAGRPGQLLAIAVADGYVEDEGWRIRKDGTPFWANVTITALRSSDGRLRGFGKVTRDLTERKRGEETLRESEERFRLLVEQVRDYAIFLLDSDGRVASWNEGAERLKGYRADEIIGQHFSRFYPDADVRRGKCDALLEQALAQGAVEDEGWRVRRDGTRFWADVVITALHDATGELRGFAKVTRDLTERKRAEDALRGVLEREREVAASLREMDKVKDEILSVVAHDMRTPVTVLDGLLETLDGAWDGLSDDEKRDAIRRMSSSTARLRGLVEDVMDVTRIDTGEMRYALSEFDADALAASVVNDVSVADADRIVLEHSGSASAKARGDERRSWQVLVNLVSNALKFSPVDTPVRLRVLDTDTGEVHFAVEDQGPGVAPEDQVRIFEKFGRGGGVGGEGTGLGLYIADSLASGQGGRILVRSDLGKGSTFTFALPKADGGSRAVGAADEPPPKRERALRIVDSSRGERGQRSSDSGRIAADG